MDTLDAQSHHESAPLRSVFWFLLKEVSNIFGEIEESLFHEPADHSRIGSAAGNCSGCLVVFVDFLEKSFSHAIVGAL